MACTAEDSHRICTTSTRQRSGVGMQSGRFGAGVPYPVPGFPRPCLAAARTPATRIERLQPPARRTAGRGAHPLGRAAPPATSELPDAGAYATSRHLPARRSTSAQPRRAAHKSTMSRQLLTSRPTPASSRRAAARETEAGPRRQVRAESWKCQSPVPTWKNMLSDRNTAVITFAKKSTKRKKGNFHSESKDSLLISEEAASSSGGSASTSLEVNSEDVTPDDQISGAPRSAVLQACTLTSGLLLAGGILLRQAGHLASLNGWSITDPADVSFNFEAWHLELVAGLVIVISSSRYILLQTWSDFRASSEAANRQILTSLEPLDYIVIACLPGISEELFFRGALMPVLGLNWISALMVGIVFGVLHLGNGRKYSFAIWATFVGFSYGLGTIASSSVIVPMASHAINNIIAGLLWRFTKNSQK